MYVLLFIMSFKENYISEYFDLMEYSHKITKDNLISNINVSTMTFVCDLGVTINLENLTMNFNSPSYPLCVIKKAKSNKHVFYTKRGKVKKSFYNQTTISYNLNNNVSVKVFTNGKLQLTGITSINNCLSAIGIIILILKRSEGALQNVIPCIENVTNMSIEMINSNFNIKKELDLKKMRSILINENVDFNYEPDTYPGINAKINKISVFIFGTGNIVITGAKSLKCIEKTYRYICNLLLSNTHIYLKDGKGLKKSKKLINYTQGYPEHMCESCF